MIYGYFKSHIYKNGEIQSNIVENTPVGRVTRNNIFSVAALAMLIIGGSTITIRAPALADAAIAPQPLQLVDDSLERRKYQVETMRRFSAQDFVRLDADIALFHGENARWPSGVLKSQHSYEAIRLAVAHNGRRPEASYVVLRQLSAEWVKQQGASAAAHVAHAIVLREHAAQALVGSMLNSEVSSQKSLFILRTRETYRYLLDVKDIGSQEPQWYAELIANAVNLGENRAVIAGFFQEGVKRFPNYDPIYTAMASTSVPAKGGSIDAMQAVAAAAEMQSALEQRSAVLGRLYLHFSDIIDRRVFFIVFSWEHVRPAMVGMMRAHPTRPVMNRVAQLACHAGDHVTSHEAFRAILLIETRDMHGWENQQEMARCLSAAILPQFRVVQLPR
jgi:hypothetical protein